jgi:hypothetical protein
LAAFQQCVEPRRDLEEQRNKRQHNCHDGKKPEECVTKKEAKKMAPFLARKQTGWLPGCFGIGDFASRVTI